MQETDWVAVRAYWLRYRPTLQQLADRFDVSLSAIKSRKAREKWGVATKGKKVATNGEKVATNKKRAKMYRKKKTPGNPNPVNKFTKRNQVGVKHGMYSKYIPEETLELIKEVNGIEPTDILWGQIALQYAAIIRAQRIMFVENEGDHTLFTIEESEYGDKKEVHAAWDKQSKFMASQTRAISELRSLIKQYVAIADEADERKVKLQAMQANVEKTKLEVEKMASGDVKEPLQIEVIRK